MSAWTRFRQAVGYVLKGGVPFPFDQISGGAGLLGAPLGKPMASSVWVSSAIRHITGPVAGLSLSFSAGDTEVDLPELERYWRQPAKRLANRAEFVRASIGWRKLAGECFWLLDDSFLVPFPEARTVWPRLILARPDAMRHVTDGGELLGWDYTDGAGRRHRLLPEQVIQLRQWNPYDEFRGLGEYEAARIDAETAAGNARFLRALAESNGDQGVYVVAKSGLPDDAQRTQIIAQLREKRALQQQGIFKPVFLTGDIEVADPKVRSADAAFFAGQLLSAEAIYVAFGVPPSMTTKAASYSIGSASDYYRLILDTCQPESHELAAAIGQVSALLTGRALEAEFDWDDHPVMQEVRKERLASLATLCDRGMPLKDAGDYLELDLPRFPGDDVGYLPFSVSPVSVAAADPAAEPALQEPTEAPDPVAEALAALRCRHGRAPAATPPVCGKATAAEAAAWRSHMKQRVTTVRTYERAYTRVLFSARAEVLRKLDAHATAGRAKGGGDTVTKAGAWDFLFDLDGFRSALNAAFRAAGQNALQAGGTQLFAEVGKDDPFTYPPAKAIQFLRERENKLSEVADEVHDRIKAVLEDGLNAGDSIEQIAGLVRGEFNDLSHSRATTIAMTETAAAYGTARQEGMAQAGVAWKQWLTSGGDNVRATHAAANGQTVAADEAFTVGGEQLRFPGDPNGSAGNVINCHCVAVAVAEGPIES